MGLCVVCCCTLRWWFLNNASLASERLAQEGLLGVLTYILLVLTITLLILAFLVRVGSISSTCSRILRHLTRFRTTITSVPDG